MSLGFKISGMRVSDGTWGNALAFFNVAFGEETDEGLTPLFVVKDFALRPTNAGGFWIDPPNKPRIKNGEAVKGDDGFPIRDAHFDVAFEEKSDGSFVPSKAALSFKKQIAEAAVALYEALNVKGASKGKAKPAPKAKAATATRSTGESSRGTPVQQDDDEEFPF